MSTITLRLDEPMMDLQSSTMRVREVMTRYPERIHPDALLTEAAQKMMALDVGMLIVCENEELVGTLTDRDIVVRGLALGAPPDATLVRSVMSPGAVSCVEDWDVEEAAMLMEENRVRRLPVLSDEGRIVGIVSLGDLAVRTGNACRAGTVLVRVSASVSLGS